MIEAARRNKRVVQVGTQSRSTAHVRQAMERLRGGAIGDVLVSKAWNSQRRNSIGHAKPSDPPVDARLRPVDRPGADGAVSVQPAAGHLALVVRLRRGDMGNDGVHDIDIACWGLGVDTHPTSIAALGGKYFFDDDQQFPDTQYVVFEYPGDGKVGHKRQLIFEQRIWSPYVQEGYENGNAFYGTKGMMMLGQAGRLQDLRPAQQADRGSHRRRARSGGPSSELSRLHPQRRAAERRHRDQPPLDARSATWATSPPASAARFNSTRRASRSRAIPTPPGWSGGSIAKATGPCRVGCKPEPRPTYDGRNAVRSRAVPLRAVARNCLVMPRYSMPRCDLVMSAQLRSLRLLDGWLVARRGHGSAPRAAGVAEYVIQISVDGLGASYLQALIDEGQVAHLQAAAGRGRLDPQRPHRFRLHDHAAQSHLHGHGPAGEGQGRPIPPAIAGHNWTINTDPGDKTMHSNRHDYVKSTFDVAHDNGLRTCMFASKSKFVLYDQSYDDRNGAPDTIGRGQRPRQDRPVREGRQFGGADRSLRRRNESQSVQVQLRALSRRRHGRPRQDLGQPGVHRRAQGGRRLPGPDPGAGRRPTRRFKGKTAIIISADHGGKGLDHGFNTQSAQLHDSVLRLGRRRGARARTCTRSTASSRGDPQATRPDYADAGLQPIRNGDGGNLALKLLGLGADSRLLDQRLARPQRALARLESCP